VPNEEAASLLDARAVIGDLGTRLASPVRLVGALLASPVHLARSSQSRQRFRKFRKVFSRLLKQRQSRSFKVPQSKSNYDLSVRTDDSIAGNQSLGSLSICGRVRRRRHRSRKLLTALRIVSRPEESFNRRQHSFSSPASESSTETRSINGAPEASSVGSENSHSAVS